MLGADNALDEEPVHTVQDNGTDVDEDVGCDGKADVVGIIGPCYSQRHGNDPDLAETCDILVMIMPLGSDEGVHTEYSAIEYELVPAMLVTLEDLDVDDTKDEIEDKKNDREWHVRNDPRCATQASILRCVRRTLSGLPRCSRLFMVSCG
jgi:hypothetical protein